VDRHPALGLAQRPVNQEVVKTIVESLGPICPPLRLIVTSECNGTCSFCHHEGLKQLDRVSMTEALVREVAVAAQELAFRKIVVSGGEPTLLEELPAMLGIIREVCPEAALGLVTNGLGLRQHWNSIREMVDNLDVSVLSLQEHIYTRFTRVDPVPLFELLSSTGGTKPNICVNSVVFSENAADLPDLLSMAVDCGLSLTLMVPLPAHAAGALSPEIPGVIMSMIEDYAMTNLRLASTPVLEREITPTTTLRIKLPSLSGLIRWKRCMSCSSRERCGEFFCAVRVYPGGEVAPCRIRPPIGKAEISEGMAPLLLRAVEEMSGPVANWTELVPWITSDSALRT